MANQDFKDKRKSIETFVIKYIDMMEPSGTNSQLYKDMFSKMNDKEFEGFMLDIKEKKRKLVLYTPNMKINLRIKNLIAAAKELGIKLQEKLNVFDPTTKRYIKTPHEYLVLYLPIRRVKQFLMDKLSVPESDTTIDLLTGQVVKPDKGSSISLVELQTILSKNLTNTITEFTRVRGGDIHAYASFKSQLEETGTASLADIDPSSRVRSSVVAHTYLLAMHIDNNL